LGFHLQAEESSGTSARIPPELTFAYLSDSLAIEKGQFDWINPKGQ
jgi:hypothetical protein